jgi:hypothetical protein
MGEIRPPWGKEGPDRNLREIYGEDPPADQTRFQIWSRYQNLNRFKMITKP